MRIKKLIFVVSITFILMAAFGVGVYAFCTDVVAGKDATIDGSVMTSHTVDWRYDSDIQIVPAQDYAPGTMAPVYYNIPYNEQAANPLIKLGEIPQVPHTYKYFHGAYPYANEFQLIIGETTIGGASETINSEDAIMTIEQAEIFALERTKTAREAIKLMGELMEKYGYRQSAHLGECLTVTDPNEAWVFEVFGVGPIWSPKTGKPGAVWAAQRVPDDHITCVPNSSRIDEIKNLETRDDLMVSSNYIEVAEELGLYDSKSGEPFIWKYIYGDAENFDSWAQYYRLYSVYNYFSDEEYKLEDAYKYPFSVKPNKKVTKEDYIKLYTNSLKGSPYDITEDPGWYYSDSKGEKVKSLLATPQVTWHQRDLLGVDFDKGDLGSFARYYCSYFWFSQARSWLPDEIGGVIWYGLDNPENSPFVPMYVGVNSVPESWVRLERDEYDEDSAWWAFASVDDLVNQYYGILKPRVDAVKYPMQEHMFMIQEPMEAKALEIYNTEGVEAAKEFLTLHTHSYMHWAESAYWDLTKKLKLWTNNNGIFQYYPDIPEVLDPDPYNN